MRSTLRSWLLLLMPVLLTVLLGGCCKSPKPPAQPVVQVPVSCVSPAMAANKPPPPDPTTCSHQGHSVVDCLAHDVLVRDAYIIRLLANCGVKP